MAIRCRYNHFAWEIHTQREAGTIMILRVLLSALLSAIVMMAWAFGFRGLLPFADMVIHPLPDADVIVLDLKQTLTESGVYYYPMPPRPSDPPDVQAEARNLHVEGPLVQIHYRSEGAEPLGIDTLVMGFAHFFVSALLLGAVLAAAAPALPSYGARAGVGILIVLFSAVFQEGMNPIWFHHTWPFYFVQFGYDCGNAVLMGLVGAAVIKRGGTSKG